MDDYEELLALLRDGVTDMASLVEDMARERGDIAGLLLALASGEATETAWNNFVDAVDEWREMHPEDADALAAAVQEALARLDEWPDDVRLAPAAWWNEAQEAGTPPPGWDAVRTLEAVGSHHGFAPCKLEAALADLTIIRTDDSVVAPEQLAGAGRLDTLTYEAHSGSRLDPPEDLAALGRLTQVRAMHLTLLRNADLTPLAGLTQLEELSLTFRLLGISRPVDLAPLAALTQLTALTLEDDERPFASAEALAGLKRLTRLRIRGPGPDLTPLAGLPALTDLDLSGLARGALAEWQPPASLESLELFGADGLTGLAAFSGLTRLRRLRLHDAPALADASGLTALTALRDLLLQGTALVALDGLGALEHLEELQLSDHPALERVDAGGAQQTLHQAVLTRCPRLRDLGGLTAFAGLRRLVLTGLDALESLEPLAALGQLEELVLENCRRLRSVAPLAGLAALHTLHVQDCPAVEDLGKLRDNPHLRIVAH